MSVTAYIGLGSNLGDRRDYLDRAVQTLQEQPGIEVFQVSSYCETAPVGGPPGQGNYLNAAAGLRTDLEPDDLLQLLLDVEQTLGRVRSEWHGPRTIDLDLLLYGDLIVEQPGLIVPHERMHERLFVLGPLAEIAPQAFHAGFGCTVADLLWKLQLNQAEPPGAEPPAVPERGSRIEDRKTPQELEGLAPASVDPRSSLLDPRSAGPGRELTGLRAVVTGSTSGIGRAIALELATAGADVIIHGRRQDAARAVADRVRELGGRTQTLLAELREPDACRRLVQAAWEEWDGLDIWVNNAGADTLTGEALHWPFEQKLQELLAVDVTAAVLLSRDVGRRMKARGRGVLLNMGWDQADSGMEGDSGELFAAAKAAVMAFSKSLALSLAPEVRVNCLAPGWIRTAWGQTASAPWQERVQRETPLRRWGTPEDVAAVARWLVSPAAAFLTGQVVRINGGAVR
ncbi:MAG TPA: 2-amino-4-hydroxy-6-hydroxymethyldihydropteridine diphosphokinase [Gemmataceae bacterium]|jgi:2-amino-4-hydroxy-6-hydroxymethyldihydropteridine diphosphokinase|nr:2-amino-4-hydroxy-6-hydroxymethyldihydropteridine diphosphokinase [Gemmataceae bacterium]